MKISAEKLVTTILEQDPDPEELILGASYFSSPRSNLPDKLIEDFDDICWFFGIHGNPGEFRQFKIQNAPFHYSLDLVLEGWHQILPPSLYVTFPRTNPTITKFRLIVAPDERKRSGLTQFNKVFDLPVKAEIVGKWINDDVPVLVNNADWFKKKRKRILKA